MATRTVFGRVELDYMGQKYKVELKKDGVHIHRKHTRQIYYLDAAVLVRLSQKQTELFVIREEEPDEQLDSSVAI